MSRQDDVLSLRAVRVSIGPSTIIGVTVAATQFACVLKVAAGGSSGTMEVGGTALTWGAGYPIGASEVLSINACGTFYLAASGVTMTAALLFGDT